MPTRRLAKRAACLEVVRLLYKRKELNEHLRPVLADDYLDEEEFEGDELELVDDGRGKKNLKLKALALYPVKVFIDVCVSVCVCLSVCLQSAVWWIPG